MAYTYDFLAENVLSNYKPVDPDVSKLKYDGLSSAANNAVYVTMMKSSEISQNFLNCFVPIVGMFDYPTTPLEVAPTAANQRDNVIIIDNETEIDLVASATASLMKYIQANGTYDEDWDMYTLAITTASGSTIRLMAHEFDPDVRPVVYCFEYIQSLGTSGYLVPVMGLSYAHEYPTPAENICFIARYVYGVNDDATPVAYLDILQGFVENSKVYSMMTDVAGLVANDSPSVDLYGLLQNYTENGLYGSLKTKLSQACARTGRKGLLSCLLNSYEEVESTEVSTSGLLEFKDPATFMPKSFLSGVLNGIVQTVTSVVSLIATAINPIIGVITTAINAIWSAITSIFDSAVQTKAGFSTKTDEGTYPYYPIHVSALTKNDASSIPATQYGAIWNLVTEDVPCLIHKDSAYYILSHDSNASPNVNRIEAFIDLLDRLPTMTDDASSFVTSPSNGVYRVQYVANIPVSNFAPTYNKVTGVMDEISDKVMRKIVACNLLYFLMSWTQNFSGSSTPYIFEVTDVNGTYAVVGGDQYMRNDNDRLVDRATYWMGYLTKAIGQAKYDQDTTMLDDLSWADLATISNAVTEVISGSSRTMVHRVGSFTAVAFPAFLDQSHYKDLEDSAVSAIPFSSSFNTPIELPEYDKTQFWQDVAIAGGIALIAIGAAVATTVVASRKIRRMRAKQQGDVENTYDYFRQHTDDPEAYKAYVKAVKKNNLSAKFFGGTKYSKVNRWDEVSSGDSGSAAGLSSAWATIKESTESGVTAYSDGLTINSIAGLITGVVS